MRKSVDKHNNSISKSWEMGGNPQKILEIEYTYVDIVGVTGSIPVAPTRLLL